MKMTFKRVIASLAASVIGLALAVPMFAAGPNDPTTTHASVLLTKEVRHHELTTLPTNLEFQFKVTKGTFTPYGTGAVADPSVTPPTLNGVDDATGILTLSFSADTKSGVVDANGMTSTYKQSANLLDASVHSLFTKAGIYTYTITEEVDTMTLDAKKEQLHYNTESKTYTLKVYTSVDATTGEIVVDGGVVIDETAQLKVDPTPVDPTLNGFKFKNMYLKDAGSENPDPDPDPDPDKEKAALVVSKQVTGTGGDKTKAFTFTLAMTALDLSGETGAGAAVDTAIKNVTVDIYEKDANGDWQLVSSTPASANATFELKHNQVAYVRGDILAGSGFDVQETVPAGYTATTVTTINGTVDTSQTAAQVAGTLGEKKNSVDYTNDMDKTTPTGIIINNLPYIMLVVVAIGGMALYVVSKRRQNA